MQEKLAKISRLKTLSSYNGTANSESKKLQIHLDQCCLIENIHPKLFKRNKATSIEPLT